MRERKHVLGVVLLLVVMQLACTDDAIRKSARASDDMATIVGLAIDAKRGLATTTPPTISPEEELALTLGLQKVNAAVRAFHTQALAAKDMNPATKSQLLALFTQITQSVSELNSQGVLGIKNPEAQAKITLILSGFSGTFAAIQAALGGV
jgi:hypothetical protein